MEIALIFIFLTIIAVVLLFNYNGGYNSGGFTGEPYKNCIVYEHLKKSVKNGWDVVADGYELHLIYKDFTITLTMRYCSECIAVGDLLDGRFVKILKQWCHPLDLYYGGLTLTIMTYPNTDRDVISDNVILDIVGKVLSEENPVYKEMLDKKRNDVYNQKLNIIKIIGGGC